MTPSGNLALVAHCDWSRDAKKRWMAVALRGGDSWRLARPDMVGNTSDLLDRLQARTPAGTGIFVGFDFPIGLPRSYGRQTGLPDFRSALECFGAGHWTDWYRVCERPDEVSVRRPFFPQRPGGTRRAHLVNGLGVDGYDRLLRTCEMATADRPAACSLFWTLGGNQVGKGAITGWQEVLAPNANRIALWPFDGRLDRLLDSDDIVIAETYPGDVYGQIGIPRRPVWSKRRAEGRSSVGRYLIDAIQRRGYIIDEELRRATVSGFSEDATGEDQFDAFVGLLGMLEVVDGHRSDGCPNDPEARIWEGWILGHERGPR